MWFTQDLNLGPATDYLSDTLTAWPLNQPRWPQKKLFIALIVASSWETFQHIFCSQEHLTTSPVDRLSTTKSPKGY